MQERNPTSQEPGPGQHSFTRDAALHSLATTGERDFFGEPFRPRRGFRGAHAQTIAGNFLPRRNQLPPPEDRLFYVEPDVQVLCHCHWQTDRSTAMTLVIVHGLEGSSDSGYVIGTGSKAWCAGMNVVRMNMRNCGNTESLGPTLYNSSMSADVGAVAEALIAEERLQKLAFAGFSMGGNLVLKLLGEWGENAPPQVMASIGVSPSMDLAPSADALHDRANRVYEMKFLWGYAAACNARRPCIPAFSICAICAGSAACVTSTTRSRRVTAAFSTLRTTTRARRLPTCWTALRFLR